MLIMRIAPFAMKADAFAMKQRKQSGSKVFHAVEIHCGKASCPAALLLLGRRFLSRGAPPMLPLAECDRPDRCPCRYQHHADRRDDSRRDTDVSGSGIRRVPEKNRRTGRGRRLDD